MTKIVKVDTKCYICGKEYSGNVVVSWYGGHPKPEIEPLVCPSCGAPYKGKIKQGVGNAKGILSLISSDSEKAVKRLVNYSLVPEDLDCWEKVMQEIELDDWLTGDKKFFIRAKEREQDMIHKYEKVLSILEGRIPSESIDESVKEQLRILSIIPPLRQKRQGSKPINIKEKIKRANNKIKHHENNLKRLHVNEGRTIEAINKLLRMKKEGVLQEQIRYTTQNAKKIVEKENKKYHDKIPP